MTVSDLERLIDKKDTLDNDWDIQVNVGGRLLSYFQVVSESRWWLEWPDNACEEFIEKFSRKLVVEKIFLSDEQYKMVVIVTADSFERCLACYNRMEKDSVNPFKVA